MSNPREAGDFTAAPSGRGMVLVMPLHGGVLGTYWASRAEARALRDSITRALDDLAVADALKRTTPPC